MQRMRKIMETTRTGRHQKHTRRRAVSKQKNCYWEQTQKRLREPINESISRITYKGDTYLMIKRIIHLFILFFYSFLLLFQPLSFLILFLFSSSFFPPSLFLFLSFFFSPSVSLLLSFPSLFTLPLSFSFFLSFFSPLLGSALFLYSFFLSLFCPSIVLLIFSFFSSTPALILFFSSPRSLFCSTSFFSVCFP